MGWLQEAHLRNGARFRPDNAHAALEGESDGNHQIESSDSLQGEKSVRTWKALENKHAIVQHLMINGPSKSPDIADAIDLKMARTDRILREMVAAGTVQAEGQASKVS